MVTLVSCAHTDLEWPVVHQPWFLDNPSGIYSKKTQQYLISFYQFYDNFLLSVSECVGFNVPLDT